MKNFFKILLLFSCISIGNIPTKNNINLNNNLNNILKSNDNSSTIKNYYKDIDTSKTGLELQDEITTLITNTHNTSANSYEALKTQFASTDIDPTTNSGLLLFYTGTKVDSYSSYGANREHVWPKDAGKAFPEKSGPGSDLQHLRPTDSQLNSSRGSLSFDEVEQTTANIVKEGGSTSYANLCYKNNSFFYPGKGYRGATARILFYVQTRYKNEYNLSFVDEAGKTKTIGKISTLMKRHLEEPVTESEILRNQKAYEIQGNRNPFIDHPEWAIDIYTNDNSSYASTLKNVVNTIGNPYSINQIKPTSISLDSTSLELNVSEKHTFSLSYSPSDATKTITWKIEDPTICKIEDNTVEALKVGNTTITAISTLDNSIYATCQITVINKDIDLTDISFETSELILEENEIVPIKITNSPANAYPIPTYTYKIDDTSIAKLNINNELVGLRVGSTYLEVIAKQNDIEITKKIKITVNEKSSYSEEEISSFSTLEGNIVENGDFEYSCEQGGGTSAPAIYDNVIRLYQNKNGTGGGSITIKSKSNKNISSFTIGTAMSTTFAYTINNSESEKISLEKDDRYTIENVNYPSITITCYGTTKNTRFYVNYIKVTYGKESDNLTHVNNIAFNKNVLELKENDTFDFDISISPENADNKKYSYKIDDENIVSLENNKLTALKEGKTNIYVISSDNNLFDICIVTVTKEKETPTPDPTPEEPDDPAPVDPTPVEPDEPTPIEPTDPTNPEDPNNNENNENNKSTNLVFTTTDKVLTFVTIPTLSLLIVLFIILKIFVLK